MMLPRVQVSPTVIVSVALLTCFIVLAFVNARTWLADVREHADPHLTCILVANKTDLCGDKTDAAMKQREVPTEEGELWAKEEGLLFVEASAKSGLNVDFAFLQASRDILDKVQRGVFDEGKVCSHSHHFAPILVIHFIR